MLEKRHYQKGVKLKLTQQVNAGTQDNSISYLPVYKDGNDDINSSKSINLDKKFVQINHNGEVIYRRKTTLVWLFQENERVPNDCVFRVRSHQPYTSSQHIITSKFDDSEKPLVKNCVSLGDICIFFRDSMSVEPKCEQWAAEKVIQFAFHKQKDQQYKKSEAPIESSIGISCSWFKQDGNKFSLVPMPGKSARYISLRESYICSVSLGCMKNIKSSDITYSSVRHVPMISKLYTASEFFLDHEALEMIDLYIAEKKQKLNSHIQKPRSKVIDLIDGDMHLGHF